MTESKGPEKRLPRSETNEDKSVTIYLLEPIRYGENEVFETMTFKRPKAKQMRKVNLESLGVDDILNLAGKLGGYAPSVMDELGMDDLFELSEVVGDFFPDTARVGSKV